MQTEILSCNYSYHSSPLSTIKRQGFFSYLFRMQTEGFCYALVDGKMTRIESGDLLLYEPGSPYELQITGDENATVVSGDYYLYCQGEWINEWWARSVKAQRTRIDPNDGIRSLWRQLILENRRVGEKNSELSDYLLRSLCLSLDRAMSENHSSHNHIFTASRMKRYIEEHATHIIKVEDVARHVQLSISRAAHIFKDSYNETMIQYLVKVRLAMAVERMQYSSFTLEHIAESCGLGSYPYFHRVFKQRYGSSPKQYRAQLIDSK
ncbi:AraC family transcriptional regulator [Paenibacillus eucommiae]|uniref:AraC family transcriptional regulator of arabinose operon n=1 Tax=Paenibacillus eucommiae TaxID=1355755 RepID=A0ABS4J1R6_9BACL|nr:AraC family transcriptional regulator [Paenibacillus eucommiae]MBP1993762.1 AraC family transcriptional regulator of arabinose operon [Paenibacillus eucommiae]